MRYDAKNKAEREFLDWLAGVPMVQGEWGDAQQIAYDHDVTDDEARQIAEALGRTIVTATYVEFERDEWGDVYCADYLAMDFDLYRDLVLQAAENGEITNRKANQLIAAARNVRDGILDLSPAFRAEYERRVAADRELDAKYS